MAHGSPEETLTHRRAEVRWEVYLERRMLLGGEGRGWFGAPCDVCWQPRPDALHEALVTRGDVRGNPALLVAIMHKFNCVLVHNAHPFRDGLTCHQWAATREGQLELARVQVARYGAPAIVRWLEALPMTVYPAELVRRLGQIAEFTEV